MPTGDGAGGDPDRRNAFILYSVQASPSTPAGTGFRRRADCIRSATALFTTYLLPFEITSILLLMAIVGAMTLARRGGLLSPTRAWFPAHRCWPMDIVDPRGALTT